MVQHKCGAKLFTDSRCKNIQVGDEYAVVTAWNCENKS